MTKKILIMDTTLRDGEQTAGVSFTVEEKLTIAKSLLIDTKIDSIEIGSARVSEGEFQAIKKICSWAKSKKLLDKIEVLGFVDNNTSVDWIHKTGCRVINLLCKGSLAHLKKQLKKTPEQHIEEINKIVKYANNMDMEVNIYLEDVSNGLIGSKDYVHFLLESIKGAKRFMLPDTLGIWTPAETKRQCEELVYRFNKEFDFHAHNDYGLAVANSMAAVEAGITRIHTTVNGLGERTGNCELANITSTINDHTSFETNIEEENLSNLSRLVESISGIRVPSNAPIVGENVFTQCCGVHADGDKKGDLYCNKLAPERFGKKRIYALGKTSGKASIQKNLDLLGIELDEESQKKVLKKVVELGDKKESITLQDLPYIVSDVLGETIEQEVVLKEFKLRLDNASLPSAEITIEINKKEHSSVATGDGQYDAFMKALKKVYKKIGVKLPKLVDYNVRIPPGGKTDALVETTIIWENETRFKTKGVDPDQTTAAIKATTNMLNKLNSP